MPKPADEPTYASYLHISELLGLQAPLSSPPHPDELHFIVTHQAMELWFKVMIDDVVRVTDALAHRRWSTAVLGLRRVNDILDAQTRQMATLQHLPPRSFLDFRGFLGTASGFQSEQFRVIEVLSGLRDADYLASISRMRGGRLPEAIETALATPSMAQVAEAIPRAAWGGATWQDVYAYPDRFDTLVLVGEQLLEYDQLWMGWRFEHIVLIERVLGRKVRGTAGTVPAYLDARLPLRFFPFLWDVRHDLARVLTGSGGSPVVGPDGSFAGSLQTGRQVRRLSMSSVTAPRMSGDAVPSGTEPDMS